VVFEKIICRFSNSAHLQYQAGTKAAQQLWLTDSLRIHSRRHLKDPERKVCYKMTTGREISWMMKITLLDLRSEANSTADENRGWNMIMYRINDHPSKYTLNKQTPSEISSFWFKYVFKEISLSQGVSLHARSAATILFCRDLATATHCNKLRKAATYALSSSCQKCQNNSLAETWQFFELLYLQSPPRPHACPHTTHAHMGDIYMWVVYKCTLNRRSLLQNIVSFIGLFCKRDLYFDRSYWP